MKKNNITSLYIHIPFCESICNYCDFPKLQYFRNFAFSYLEALEKEINEVVVSKNLKTIYIGGGTPTALEDDLFERLLKIVEPFSTKVEEYTIEANPECLSVNKISLMKKYGVNRVSIGVESTNDNILKAINRHHNFLDVQKAVLELRKQEINNINLDLILGLPNVTFDLFKKDVDNLLSLSPTHISIYSLTVHPHTMFFLNKINEPSDDYSRELYDYAHQKLLEKGYEHYEISNFSLPGYNSKHNLVYWNNEKYYGIGLAAAGYIDDYRYKNTDNFAKYIEGNNEKEVEYLSKKDEDEYSVILNLRTKYGLDLNINKDLYINKKREIEELIKQGLLVIEDNHLIATYEGMMILDQIILKLI